MPDERTPPPPPTLDYQSPGANAPSIGRRVWLWLSYPGSDSFLGCAALFFAMMAWCVSVLGFGLAGLSGAVLGGCFGVLLDPLAVVFGLGALLERETSKTFPAVAIVSGGVHLLAVFVVPRLV